MSLGNSFGPVGSAERIITLDVLRGFALFGILLVNIEGIVGPLNQSLSGTDLSLTGADLWADAAVYILAQGKFYSIFSLLFGMGFAVMLSRAQSAGRSFFPVYIRRMLLLAAMGIAHALLLRAGDILFLYAMFGLLLIPFRNTPQSRLPKYSFVFYFAPVLLILAVGALASAVRSIPGAAGGIEAGLQEQQVEMQTSIEAQRAAFGSGTYADAVAQSAEDFIMMIEYMIFIGWQILGLFLLGVWFMRSGAIARPGDHAQLYKALQWVALPMGLAMMLASFIMLPSNDFTRMNFGFGLATALNLTGSLLMSLGYVALVVRGLESPSAGRWLRWLAPAGQMALTNYLLQSLVCALIFNNYGLGYYEQLSRAWQIPFTIAVFVLQVLFSRWWMERFRFGPAEWLWRAATYLKLPRMTRKPPPMPLPAAQ